MTDKTERKGGCLCGAVRVTVPAMSGSVGACHCSMCRKWGGGPFLAIECGTDVHFAGEEDIVLYQSSGWAERGFCGRCGTHLFYRLKQDGQYALPAGLLDDLEGLVLDHQIFVDEKPPLYEFANRTKNLTGAEVFELFGVAPE